MQSTIVLVIRVGRGGIAKMNAKGLLLDAAAETGWDEDSQITVLCDFIDQMGQKQPNFQRYLNNRVDEELDMEEEETIKELESTSGTCVICGRNKSNRSIYPACRCYSN